MLNTKWFNIPYGNGKYLQVFIFRAYDYNETNKPHVHHNCKRVWSACEWGRKSVFSGKRTRQVERWCQNMGIKPEVTTTET